MSAYVIASFTPRDQQQLQQYGAAAAETIAQFSGEFLVKGPAQVLSGDFEFKNQVIIQFPSLEKAQSWYQSDAYQALIPLREKGMEASFQLVGA